MYLKLEPLIFRALIFLCDMATIWLWKIGMQKAEMAIPLNTNQWHENNSDLFNQTAAHNRTVQWHSGLLTAIRPVEHE